MLISLNSLANGKYTKLFMPDAQGDCDKSNPQNRFHPESLKKNIVYPVELLS